MEEWVCLAPVLVLTKFSLVGHKTRDIGYIARGSHLAAHERKFIKEKYRILIPNNYYVDQKRFHTFDWTCFVYVLTWNKIDLALDQSNRKIWHAFLQNLHYYVYVRARAYGGKSVPPRHQKYAKAFQKLLRQIVGIHKRRLQWMT